MVNTPGRLDICLVAAMTPNRVIGRGGILPWRLPSDMQRFRTLTLGHSVVMGYVTFAEIIARRGAPLDGRTNYVVTRRHTEEVRQWGATPVDNVFVGIAETWVGALEYYVIGGASVYQKSLPLADRICITIVDGRHPRRRLLPTH